MATREIMVGGQPAFDREGFHRTAAMRQTDWAQNAARNQQRSAQLAITRYSNVLNVVLPVLLALVLRPIDLRDIRDVTVSLLALGASLLVASLIVRVTLSFVRTTRELDRVAMWAFAFVVGVVLSVSGVVSDFSRDAGDYLTEVHGYELSASEAAVPSADFADVGLWRIERESSDIGSVGVFIPTEAQHVTRMREEGFLRSATSDPNLVAHRDRMAGKSVVVGSSGGQVSIGWLTQDGTLVVVSGGHMRLIEPYAAGLLKHSDR